MEEENFGKRKRAYVYEDEEPDKPYISVQAKDLRVGDCCFTSITAPPNYLGKVVGTQKTDDGRYIIEFSNESHGMKTSQEVVAPEKSYFRLEGREMLNPYARKKTLSVTKRTAIEGGRGRSRRLRRRRSRRHNTRRQRRSHKRLYRVRHRHHK